MIIATEKDCMCQYKQISKDDAFHCKICKGFINYDVGF